MQNFTTIWQRTRNRLETIVGTMVAVLLLFLLWTWISENREAWERAHRISTPTGGSDPVYQTSRADASPMNTHGSAGKFETGSGGAA